MEEEFFTGKFSYLSGQKSKTTIPSTAKTFRTMQLAILFQVAWPERLTRQEIIDQIPLYGKSERQRAFYRDIETLTDSKVEDLPEPDAENLRDWCAKQQNLKRLAISYNRSTNTFGLEQSLFFIDITEDEARAFVTLQEGFSPGTPYANAVQNFLTRWEWLFSEKSHRLVNRKRQRRARPFHLPLSPVVDYSKHEKIILDLDQALEEGAYVSFAYFPLSRSWDSEPVKHEHLEPFELEYRDGHWYLTAYVLDTNTFLDFRVDRIQIGSLHKLENRFLPGQRRQPGIKIKYWISPTLARHGSVSVRLREQRVTILDKDHGAIVEGYAKSIWWAARLLLGYGEQAKALEPDKLVLTMRETISAMSKAYEKES